MACGNSGSGRTVGLDDLVGPFQPCDSMILRHILLEILIHIVCGLTPKYAVRSVPLTVNEALSTCVAQFFLKCDVGFCATSILY